MKSHNLFLRGAGVVLFLVLGWLQSLQAITLTVTPSSVSNTYNGYITLQISGVPSGVGVVVQKFLDANSNGVVDAGDILVQQGNLTDGKVSTVIGGVTNFNVPGDNDGTANGSITAKILFNNGDFIQKTIGQFLFVISSTNGAFAPVTNAFSVTNLPYAQAITGTVTNNTGAVVPDAIVILFPPPRAGGDHGPGTPIGAGVANGSGVYSIAIPVGSYVPLAFRSNYFANFSAAPLLAAGSGQTITTNLLVSNATSSVSGSYVDSTNSGKGLAGVFVPLSTSGGLIAGGFTDSNGNFNVPVSPGQSWSVGDSSGLIVHGYVGYENNPTNVNSGATGVTIGFPRASALFYGTVLDNFGNPIPGVAIEAFDNNNNIYQQDGWTDTNGNYVTVAVGGLGSNDLWQVNVDQSPTNYVFSQPVIQQNGGTNIAVSQAVQVNFTGIAVAGAITGHVQYNGSPVAGVGVNAGAFTNGVNYQPTTAHTDSNGNYTLYVANANWGVSLNCSGGSDSVNSVLNGSFNCPQSQNVNVANNAAMANFTVQACSGVQIFSTTLPSGTVGSFYDSFLSGSTCTGNQNWALNDPQDFPGSLNFSSSGEISGTPGSSGTYNFSVNLNDGNGNSTNQSMSLTISPGVASLQINTGSLPNGTNGVFYSQALQASGGYPPYSWSLVQGSANLPANLALGTNGVVSGLPDVTANNYSFIVEVTDTNGGFTVQPLSVTIVGSTPPVRLSLVPQPGNGTLEFTFAGVSGVSYSLQSSPDLKTWTTVLGFTGSGSAETISAPTTGSKALFYRVRSP